MSSEEPTSDVPWKSGTWYSPLEASQLYFVDGEKVEIKNMISLDFPDSKAMFSGVWAQGDFGPAKSELVEKTGVQNYNVQIDHIIGKMLGILDKTGTQIDYWGLTNEHIILKCLTPEELEEIKENREPCESPSLSYIEPKPDSPGKLIWLSGPPGAGKSTTGALLGKHNGYIYYEADCFGMFVNPFVDPNVDEPTLQIMQQTPLKGVSKESVDVLAMCMEVFKEVQQNMEFTDEHIEKCQPMFDLMAKDIIHQRKRLGGNMVIAQAINSQKQRERMRKLIGPDLVFIVLGLSKECQMKRVKARHGEDFPFVDMLIKISDLYEPAGAEEENAFNVVINEDDSRDDVLQKIVDILKKC